MIRIRNLETGEYTYILDIAELPPGWIVDSPTYQITSEAPFLNWYIVLLIVLLIYLIHKAG
jgi:hypothetical protein